MIVQGVECRRALAAAVSAHEQVILAAQCHHQFPGAGSWADSALLSARFRSGGKQIHLYKSMVVAGIEPQAHS